MEPNIGTDEGKDSKGPLGIILSISIVINLLHNLVMKIAPGLKQKEGTQEQKTSVSGDTF